VLQEHYPQALEIIFEMQRQKEFKVLQEHYYPQALEIVFEVQRKRSNEKIMKKKQKLSNLQNAFFFLLFFSLDPSYFQIS